MKRFIALFTAAALTFSGCSLKNIKEPGELPSDTPWNRNIMEVDSGYYYGVNYNIHGLRYTEKSNGADIYLCAKPECSHHGEDTCTATYKNLTISNYVMYDKNIYFVADTPTENTVGFSLYKEAPDGSSLDKVTDIMKMKRANNEEDLSMLKICNSVYEFIIHKGFAYVPYKYPNLLEGDGVIGNGIAKVNIKNGDVELLKSSDTEQSYIVDAGAGDYVYYRVYSDDKNESGNFRYNIVSGEHERFTGTLGELIKQATYSIVGVTEDNIYLKYTKSYKDINEIQVFDAKTLEPTGKTIKLPNTKERMWINIYDNKIFCLTQTEVMVYSAETGERLGGSIWCNPWEDFTKKDTFDITYNYVYVRGIDISFEKVYISFQSDMEFKGLDFQEIKTRSTVRPESSIDYNSVYCCPIEDVISGNAKWTKAYSYTQAF